MRKTNETEIAQNVTVDLANLQRMLNVGRQSAEKIGKEAGAVIKMGRRKLYYVPKIDAYMRKLTEATEESENA